MQDEFENYLDDAIKHIPEKYRSRMESVAILTEEYPSAQQLDRLGLRRCAALYGLYEGVPLTKRAGGGVQLSQPDIITIFKHPMIEIFQDEKELKKQIYKTLWHEVAHFFGLDHDQIDAAGKKRAT